MNQQLRQAVEAAAFALEQGQMSEARARAEAILAAAPGEPNASQILALVLMQQGHAEDAVRHLQNAKRAAPRHPPVLNLLGTALGLAGDRAGARKNFAEAKSIAPDFLDARFNLAQLDVEDGRLAAARAEYDDILARQPLSGDGLAGRAKVALLEHDVEGAARYAQRALSFDGNNVPARLTLAEAMLRQGNFAAAHRVAGEAAALPAATPASRAHALGFVGDAADRLGNYDEAFAAYTAANDLERGVSSHLEHEPPSAYNPATVRRLIDFVKAAADDPAPPMGHDEPSPAFLVGFPRSGTTLLEQVLLAHPAVLSLGEQPVFEQACRDLVLDEDGIGRLARLTADEAAQYRKKYWKGLAALGAAPGAGQLYLDKMPANTALLPVIAKVFPHAKILFAVREPRDAVLSCFQQRFVLNQAMAQMLSLESAAAYYDLVMTLAVETRRRYSPDLREVRYETLVTAFEKEMREVVTFLGLDWDDRILTYREELKSRRISTPSAGQVTQPIYTRSLGKWRNYEHHLAPVAGRLAPWAEYWGYTD